MPNWLRWRTGTVLDLDESDNKICDGPTTESASAERATKYPGRAMLLEDPGRYMRCLDIESTWPERAMAVAGRLRAAGLRSCIRSTLTGNAAPVLLVHSSIVLPI